ncbi:MAG: DUF2807 domain-containing protein [Tunicatimonas sp.]
MISVNKNIFASLAFVCLSVWAYAQESRNSTPKEVRGSGRIVQEQRILAPFNTLDIDYLRGKITVEVGGTASSLDAQLDDNLRPFLRIEEKENRLKISLRDAQGSPVWAVDESIKVVIKTPALDRLVYNANGTLTVSGLSGDSFSFANKANGTVTLRGEVKNLDVISTANGLIQAEELVADWAKVVTQGNAAIRVNAKELKLVKSGNAQISNVSEGP